jgi:uncharacterized protein YjbI with pentapeptide repeats
MKGVAAWNAWRRDYPNVRPDLRKADLYKADLREAKLSRADLHRADLYRANLFQADLSGAGLRRAYLYKADLREAKLSRADLCEAKLHRADLREAKLSRADLRGAVLYRANLREAKLNRADLRGAVLYKADLREAKLSRADLRQARLYRANLFKANLRGANLGGAKLRGADIRDAKLSEADLSKANLRGANLGRAKLRGADIRDANLMAATLVDSDLRGADLTGCRVYGISAWRLKLEKAEQQNLVITEKWEPKITVDNIEVAQFVYLLLYNQKIRDVIDTITSKAVLILGRFTDRRKAVLDALHKELRQRGYLPILFDFEKPRARNTDETITLLARMARFVIADISDAKSVLQELRAIVPDVPSLPVQAIILETQKEPGMFDFYRGRPSFLKVHSYSRQELLISELGEKVIGPAELKVLELRGEPRRAARKAVMPK